MKYELTIETSPGARLLVQPWQNAAGRRLVCVTPQYQDRHGDWHLAKSSLMLSPDAARELAPAVLAIAAAIDASPVDPMPTAEDREASRMP